MLIENQTLVHDEKQAVLQKARTSNLEAARAKAGGGRGRGEAGARAAKTGASKQKGREAQNDDDRRAEEDGQRLGAAKKEAAPRPAGRQGGRQNLEKIRDILFGAQVDDFEKKFARLEERLLKETADCAGRDEEAVRLAGELHQQGGRVAGGTAGGEQEERRKRARRSPASCGRRPRRLEKKLGQLDEQTTKSQRELRQQILDQSKA